MVTMETRITIAVVLSVLVLGWVLVEWSKHQQPRRRSPEEEIAYQQEIGKLQAQRDYNRDKMERVREEKRVRRARNNFFNDVWGY